MKYAEKIREMRHKIKKKSWRSLHGSIHTDFHASMKFAYSFILALLYLRTKYCSYHSKNEYTV